MAKVTVKIKTPGLDSMTRKKIANKKFQQKLGARILKDILALISVGKSPVSGQGRYKGYRTDRRAEGGLGLTGKETPEKRVRQIRGEARRGKKGRKGQFYPDSVQKQFPSKQRRPVNLSLSGDMLKAMKFKGITGGVKIGLIGAKRKLKDIFESHNDGTNEKRNVPRRAILPTGASEKFTAFIQRRIKSLYKARIRQLISKANKRR